MNPDPTSLERLHDVVAAPPLPWWPPTPAWTIVLAALALAAFAALLRCFMRWQANRYRREALALLDDPATPPAEWSAILKRAALAAWPREEVADLTGDAWLAFLDRSAGIRGFVSGPGEALERIAVEPGHAATTDIAAVKAAAREWLSRHRKEAAP